MEATSCLLSVLSSLCYSLEAVTGQHHLIHWESGATWKKNLHVRAFPTEQQMFHNKSLVKRSLLCLLKALPVCAALRTSKRTGVVSNTILGWVDATARADMHRWHSTWWELCSEATVLSWSMTSVVSKTFVRFTQSMLVCTKICF